VGLLRMMIYNSARQRRANWSGRPIAAQERDRKRKAAERTLSAADSRRLHNVMRAEGRIRKPDYYYGMNEYDGWRCPHQHRHKMRARVCISRERRLRRREARVSA
jgi:hypothetical protein